MHTTLEVGVTLLDYLTVHGRFGVVGLFLFSKYFGIMTIAEKQIDPDNV